MDFLAWFDINNTLVNFPIGDDYAMSWIEAIGTVFGLLCIWFASKEKTINFFFGLINVTLFCIIFFQIQLYGLLLLQVFFFVANIYGWFAWTRPTSEGDNVEKQGSELIIVDLAGLQKFVDHFEDYELS